MLFAKLPGGGDVKTRLIPALGERGAARLYGAFLEDAVRMARRVEGVVRQLWVVPHPDAIRELRQRYVDLAIHEQPGADLGDRMRGAFDHAFGEATDYAVIVGSDLPTLPAYHVSRAFEALKTAHLVLGPTEDGGYYAIGLRRDAWPLAAGLFDEIPWSTRRVLRHTLDRAEALGLRHVGLPSWYDVDQPHQLPRLLAEADPSSATLGALRSLHYEPPRRGRGRGP